jgi:anti-sigma factor RsiW
MMKCDHLEQNAIAFLDGRLAPSERRIVEAHLAACSSCRERIQGVSGVMDLLGEWPGIQSSPFFQTRLAARLQEEPAAHSWWQTLWQDETERPFRPAARPVFALALAVVLVVATLVLQYAPAPLDPEQTGAAPGVTLASASADDLPLYQELPLLEDYEVLRNFEVLQVLSNTNPAVQ